jgi:hypothetical protein
MYGAKMLLAVGAAAACIGISGCAAASTDVADTARRDSAALRVDARSERSSAAEAQGDRLAELAEALDGGTAAEAQGDRLSAYAAAADGTGTVSSAAAHQGARLSALAEAWAGAGE